MSSVDDLQVLATSIGEFTAETIGREALKGLRVTIDRISRTGHIEVFLEDNSDAEQKRVLNDLFDIEQMYFDDVALSFSFVDEMPEDVAALEAAPRYQLA